MAEELKDKISVPVVPLLQCTDTEIFCPEGDKNSIMEIISLSKHQRSKERDCVYWAAEVLVSRFMYGEVDGKGYDAGAQRCGRWNFHAE